MVRKIPLILLALAGALFWPMGAKCLADEKQAEARYKQIASESNDVDKALWAQMKLTVLYIESNDELRAKPAFQELVTRFAEHERIAETVYHVADEYGDAKKSPKTCF